jgi:hypothetical protein
MEELAPPSMSIRAHLNEYAAGAASLVLAAAANAGLTWETVARVTATVLVSVALGAGGYFVAQQATRDSRQDLMLDSVSNKLVDISITLVKIQQSAADAQALALQERTLREQRDARELAEYRQRADEKGKK